MPIRIGEFTTVSTSNLYFYPPLGTSSIAQGYLLATSTNGFMIPQNPNTLASTIVGSGYLDSTISTTITASISTLSTYVSINTASITSLSSQVSTLNYQITTLFNYGFFQSTPLQTLNNVANSLGSASIYGNQVPTTLFSKETTILSNYSLLQVSFMLYSFPESGTPSNDVWYTCKFIPSPSLTDGGNEFVVGPFSSSNGINTSYTCLLRRGVDYITTDTALSTVVTKVSRYTSGGSSNTLMNISLMYQNIVGMYSNSPVPV
jgi:hypothetical protein